MANTLSKVTSFAAGSINTPGLYLSTDSGSGVYRPGADQIGVSISGTRRLLIASSGAYVTGVLSASATDYNNYIYNDCMSTNSGHSGYLNFRKSLNSSGVPAGTVNGETLGIIQFSGYSSSSYRSSAQIYSQQDGAVGATWSPGRIVFRTTNSSGTMTTALTISAAQLCTFAGAITVTGTATLSGSLAHSGSTIGFFGATAQTKGTITGSRGSNAALASLLTYLASIGLLTNNTT